MLRLRRPLRLAISRRRLPEKNIPAHLPARLQIISILQTQRRLQARRHGLRWLGHRGRITFLGRFNDPTPPLLLPERLDLQLELVDIPWRLVRHVFGPFVRVIFLRHGGGDLSHQIFLALEQFFHFAFGEFELLALLGQPAEGVAECGGVLVGGALEGLGVVVLGRGECLLEGFDFAVARALVRLETAQAQRQWFLRKKTSNFFKKIKKIFLKKNFYEKNFDKKMKNQLISEYYSPTKNSPKYFFKKTKTVPKELMKKQNDFRSL